MGDQVLYNFLNHNEEYEQYTVDVMNDLHHRSARQHETSVNSCIELIYMVRYVRRRWADGCIAVPGGQFDYIRGVQRSRGGKASSLSNRTLAKGGELSRIVPNIWSAQCSDQ